MAGGAHRNAPSPNCAAGARRRADRKLLLMFFTCSMCLTGERSGSRGVEANLALFLAMLLRVAGADQELPSVLRRALGEFRAYDVTVPRVWAPPSLQPLNHSLSGSGHYPEISVSFEAFHQSFVVELTLNKLLFGANYTEKSIHRDREVLHNEEHEGQHPESHCYYSGHVAGHPESSAALSTCSGIRGYIVLEDEGYHFEPYSTAISDRHYVFRDSDFIARNLTCGQQSAGDGLQEIWRPARQGHRLKKRSMRWPYDADDKTMIVELYIANDFTQFTSFQRDASVVVRRTKDIVNIVSSLYRPLNMYVALVGVEVWVDGDKIEIVDNADKTMNNFLEYRRNYISPRHRNDNAQLITGRTLGDGVVGKAPIMTICTWQYSGGVNLDHSTLVGPVATTVAHEMGHNFGLTHDVDACGCPDDRCIMAPSSGGQKNPTKWSECSKQQFADGFHQGMDYCLHNLPPLPPPGDAPVCGNGFTEPGEQCDCGLPQDCSNACCNATTCRHMPNASCAAGECCDRTTCKPKPMATTCRPAHGPCDLSEHCNGVDEYCPADVYRQDGSECLDAYQVASYCYKSRCESAEAQCRLLWGATGQGSHRLCYEHFNVMGSANGHCGFNWVEQKTFKKCEPRDVLCGMLHCRHRNEKLMFWKEALAYTLPEAMVIANGTRQDCKGVILDVGLDMPDPGMVPNGVKCGDWKMCVNQRCEDIDSLGLKNCPDCHNHGVCNSLAQCHCDPGYAPPLCDRAGNGGSEHGGPVIIRHARVGLVVGLCFFFLIVLPLIALLAYCAHRHREKLKRAWLFRQADKYRSVHRATPRNDAERPSSIVRAPAHPLGVGSSQPLRTPPIFDPTRPRSVVVHSNNSSAAAERREGIKRAQSFRTQDISGPELKSCTNHVVCESVGVPRPLSYFESATLPSPPPYSESLTPTRFAPAPPCSLRGVAGEFQQRRGPKRPPLPRLRAALSAAGESVPLRNPPARPDDAAENVYEEIQVRSPSTRPPEPPDSRHRFYSTAAAPLVTPQANPSPPPPPPHQTAADNVLRRAETSAVDATQKPSDRAKGAFRVGGAEQGGVQDAGAVQHPLLAPRGQGGIGCKAVGISGVTESNVGPGKPAESVTKPPDSIAKSVDRSGKASEGAEDARPSLPRKPPNSPAGKAAVVPPTVEKGPSSVASATIALQPTTGGGSRAEGQLCSATSPTAGPKPGVRTTGPNGGAKETTSPNPGAKQCKATASPSASNTKPSPGSMAIPNAATTTASDPAIKPVGSRSAVKPPGSILLKPAPPAASSGAPRPPGVVKSPTGNNFKTPGGGNARAGSANNKLATPGKLVSPTAAPSSVVGGARPSVTGAKPQPIARPTNQTGAPGVKPPPTVGSANQAGAPVVRPTLASSARAMRHSGNESQC